MARLDRFEGRAQLRSWLYRIATNVCLDMLGSRQRRARPMDFGPAGTTDRGCDRRCVESAWIEPVPDGIVVPSSADPAETAVARESIRLAFMAALQHLPPKQRAVLILREVLRWQASEVAELLDTTVASVNSALQRARATLADAKRGRGALRPDERRPGGAAGRYVDAFERYDMDALTSLLHEDANWNMPPYELWLNDHDDIAKWCLGPGIGCRGSRLIADRGERLAGVRPVQARRRWWPRAVVAAGPGAVRRTDRRDHVLPRHGPLVPALRPARPPGRLTGIRVGAGQDIAEAAQLDELSKLRARTVQHEVASAASRGQLKTRERLDRPTIRIGEPPHVEHNLHVRQTRRGDQSDRCDG